MSSCPSTRTTPYWLTQRTRRHTRDLADLEFAARVLGVDDDSSNRVAVWRASCWHHLASMFFTTNAVVRRIGELGETMMRSPFAIDRLMLSPVISSA